MAKRPMRQWMRDKLIAYATINVKPAAEAKALDVAYRKIEPLARKIVEAKYKPADMAICAKYQVAERDGCIKLKFDNGAVDEFTFDNIDTAPLIAAKGSCWNRFYLADQKTFEVFEKWKAASEAFKAESRKRIAAYTALVQASSSLDDVIEVWPEAATVIPAENSMIAFNPDQVAVLKADLKERKAA